MIHLQYIGLLLACIGGSTIAGLLPEGGANGYQYNRPSGQDFGSGGGSLDGGRRGFGGDRFGGFGGNGFGGRPSAAYGTPTFGNNGGVGGAAGYNTGSSGFGNRPSGNYGAPGGFTGGAQAGYQQPGGFGNGYQGNGAGDGYYQGGGGGAAGGGYNGDNGRPQPYSFQYEVRDPPSGNDYAQQESSDGNVVRGEYRVLLPDSRTQIVKYTADDANGYNADVQYEGQAQFPRGGAGGGYNQFGGNGGDAGYQGGFGPANNYQGGRGGYGNGGAFGGGIFPSGNGAAGGGIGGGEQQGGGSNRYLPPGTGGYGK